jgi:chemotaxis protein methyltransferase CheR
VTVAFHDIRTGPRDGPFDLVMCRNLVFTYFDAGLQRNIGAWLADSLRPGGALMLGAHEELPADLGSFEPWNDDRSVYRRLPDGGGAVARSVPAP